MVQYQNMHYKSTLFDLFADQVVQDDDDDSCASIDNWKYTNKVKREDDVYIISDMDILMTNLKILMIWVKKTIYF